MTEFLSSKALFRKKKLKKFIIVKNQKTAQLDRLLTDKTKTTEKGHFLPISYKNQPSIVTVNIQVCGDPRCKLEHPSLNKPSADRV